MGDKQEQILQNTIEIKASLKWVNTKIHSIWTEIKNITKNVEDLQQRIEKVEKQQVAYKISLIVVAFFVFILYVNM
jgi:septal ring factor EnvC (AmiA/AmiB activator)